MSLESRKNLICWTKVRQECDAFILPQEHSLTWVFESGPAALLHISIVFKPELAAPLVDKEDSDVATRVWGKTRGLCARSFLESRTRRLSELLIDRFIYLSIDKITVFIGQTPSRVHKISSAG